MAGAENVVPPYPPIPLSLELSELEKEIEKEAPSSPILPGNKGKK